jgi:hypothetical protein
MRKLNRNFKLKRISFFGCAFFLSSFAHAQQIILKDTVIPFSSEEVWWGSSVDHGHEMPFGKQAFTLNMYGEDTHNQVVPVLLSNKGSWIWSDEPFQFTFRNDSLFLSALHGRIEFGKAGNSLNDAYNHVSKIKFPPGSEWPDSLFITAPQYNLWIELLYNPNSKDVMKYAQDVLKNGLPAGVLMIDDNWSIGYGSFEFDFKKIPDPKQLTDSLHKLGFKVMLWVCPFISPDGESYRELAKKKLLLMDNEGNANASWKNAAKPLLVKWWNGYSACLDLSNPDAMAWIENKLKYLQQEYGVDGFKFDGGDPNFYNASNLIAYKNINPNEHTVLWQNIGLKFKLNEYRVSWKASNYPLVQRLVDKYHTWKDLQFLIPNTIAQHLMGFKFTCPDMIGGGDFVSFIDLKTIDQDLIVRSAQVQALTPMMQFSLAPWRVLDSIHLAAVKKTVALRQQYVPYIMQVMRECIKTGEPVIRPLEYAFANKGYENIKDQFMLGDKYMVAPIVANSNTREVVLPEGKWKCNNKSIKGGITKKFVVALDELLVFERL